MLAARFDAFLVDLDGVVYVDDDPVPAAASAVEELRERGKTVRFLTNNSRSPRTELAEALRDAGVRATADDLVTAASVTGSVLRSRGLESAFVVGTDGLERELRGRGVDVVASDPEAVVVGLDREATYRDIELAARAVRDGAAFVAANVDATFPTAEGVSPGTGALVSAVATAADAEPTVVGKPEPRMFEEALRGIDPDADVVMVGDNPRTDVAGAHRAGLPAILVTDHGVGEPPSEGDRAPDAVVGDLSDLLDASDGT